MGRKKNERGVRQEHKKGESKRMRREKEERRRRNDENPLPALLRTLPMLKLDVSSIGY